MKLSESLGEKLKLVTAPAELDHRGNQDRFAIHVVMSRMACQTGEACLVVRCAKVRLVADSARLTNCRRARGRKTQDLIGIASFCVIRTRTVATFAALL